ncbi:MAG: hypothetical protein RL545_144 [Actinomycetota bacterium]|jgi:ribosomal protein S18 acetylase RimI-like enzyme
MIFREIRESDRAAWDVLWAGYLEFYEQELSAEQTELTWSRLFDDSVRLHGFVAEVDGEVVGLAHCWFTHTTWLDKADLYLEDLFVSPLARRRGVGELLIRGCADFARESGSSSLYWFTHKNNLSAQRLYDKVASRSEFIIFEKAVK